MTTQPDLQIVSAHPTPTPDGKPSPQSAVVGPDTDQLPVVVCDEGPDDVTAWARAYVKQWVEKNPVRLGLPPVWTDPDWANTQLDDIEAGFTTEMEPA
jgi:hypothetical protein